MAEETDHGTTESEAVDQQQACSPPSRAWKTKAEIVAIEICPACGEYGVIRMGGSKLGEEPSGKHKMCLKCDWHTGSAENA